MQADDRAITNIFPDINPRNLRIAEVKSWYCDWMDKQFRESQELNTQSALPRTPPPVQEPKRPAFATSSRNGTPLTPPLQSPRMDPGMGFQADGEPDEFDDVIHQIASELTLEEKYATPVKSETPGRNGTSPTPFPTTPPLSKRPQLRLKLEDMPTPQQAEDRAQRAANRLIAKREAMEKAMETPSEVPERGDGASATQNAILRLNFKSYSSGDDSDVQSPSGEYLCQWSIAAHTF